MIDSYKKVYPQEYYLTFAAIFILIGAVTMPNWMTMTIIPMVIGFVPDEKARHIAVDLYLPQIIDASS